MTPAKIPTAGLIRLQQILWYSVFALFLVICVLYPFDLQLSAQIAFWGVILIVVGTAVRIIFLSELFRRAGRTGLWTLCGILLLVLIGTILLKYLN